MTPKPKAEETLENTPYNLPWGSEVIYTAAGGWPGQKEAADKLLERGKSYIMSRSVVHGFATTFYLDGIEGGFNHCLFSVRRTLANDEGEKESKLEVEAIGNLYSQAIEDKEHAELRASELETENERLRIESVNRR